MPTFCLTNFSFSSAVVVFYLLTEKMQPTQQQKKARTKRTTGFV
jgi:hypothetical protein